MKSSSLYIGNTIAAVVVFFLIRIVTIVPNWWIFFASIYTPAWDQVGLIHKFICVGSTIPLDILNVYWFWKIIKIIIKYFKSDYQVNGNSINEKYD